MANIIAVIYDNESPFLTAYTGELRLWMLTDEELVYNPDAFGAGSWDVKQSLTGYTILRSLPGGDSVAGYIGGYVGNSINGTPELLGTVTFSGGSDLPNTIVEGTVQNVSGDDVLRKTGAPNLGTSGHELMTTINFAQPTLLTKVTASVFSDVAGSTGAPRTQGINTFDDDTSASLGSDGATLVDDAWNTFEVEYASPVLVTNLRIQTQIGTSVGQNADFRLDDIEIEGYAIANHKVFTSIDTGDTIHESTLNAFSLDDGFDTDDYNRAWIGAGSGNRLYYVAAYDDTTPAYLDGSDLTGLASATTITCVRIPFLTLDQTPNDDLEALEFLYATNATTENLWRVVFDATTGTVISEEDITPVISGTTYYIVSPNALETSGANTQVILAFAEPVGGGTRRLIRSLNGGTSWTIAQSIDGNFVRWRPGSQQEVWLSGADGIFFSSNRASTTVNRTAGTTGDVLGVIGL